MKYVLSLCLVATSAAAEPPVDLADCAYLIAEIVEEFDAVAEPLFAAVQAVEARDNVSEGTARIGTQMNEALDALYEAREREIGAVVLVCVGLAEALQE